MSLLALVEKFDTYGDNSNAMEMTSDAHMIGKEAELWQYINEGKCCDIKVLEVTVEKY